MTRKKLLLIVVAASGFDASFTLTIRDPAGFEYDLDSVIQQAPN